MCTADIELLEQQWQCSAFNSSDSSSSLPALSGAVAEVGKDRDNVNLLDASTPGTTFIYPVPMEGINCSGTVTAVEYCYRNSDAANNFGSNQLVFTLATLNQSRAVFSVIDTIEIFSIPDNHTCTSVLGSLIHCCDVSVLPVANQFQLPVSNFAVGLTISDSNVSLLGYRSNSLMDVTYYRSSVVKTISYTNLLRENGPLRLLQFRISKYHP